MVTYDRGHHRYALVLACATFLLLIAGALVTSNDAGLSVPDWPTSFGSLYRIPPMTGGIKFEHSHRMIAQFVGLLTVLFAAAVQWGRARKARRNLFVISGLSLAAGLGVRAAKESLTPEMFVNNERIFFGLAAFFAVMALGTFLPFHEARGWMRRLGWIALGLVIVQGVLGGITVLTFLPWYVSTAHATVAQTFFALAVLFFVFTGTDWTEKPRVLAKNSGGTHKLAVLAVCAVYFQLITGAGFRHHGFSVMWHVLGAAVAAIVLIWTAGHILRHYDSPALRTPAKALLGLIFLQLGLGVTVYFTRVIWGKDAPQPLPSMVYSTVAHVAIGALVLACTVVLLAQSYRSVARENTLEAIPAKAVTV